MFEVWGAGNTYAELKASVREHSGARMVPWLAPSVRFKWIVSVFGTKVSMKGAVGIMNDLTSVVPFQARPPRPALVSSHLPHR